VPLIAVDSARARQAQPSLPSYPNPSRVVPTLMPADDRAIGEVPAIHALSGEAFRKSRCRYHAQGQGAHPNVGNAAWSEGFAAVMEAFATGRGMKGPCHRQSP